MLAKYTSFHLDQAIPIWSITTVLAPSFMNSSQEIPLSIQEMSTKYTTLFRINKSISQLT